MPVGSVTHVEVSPADVPAAGPSRADRACIPAQRAAVLRSAGAGEISCHRSIRYGVGRPIPRKELALPGPCVLRQGESVEQSQLDTMMGRLDERTRVAM